MKKLKYYFKIIILPVLVIIALILHFRAFDYEGGFFRELANQHGYIEVNNKYYYFELSDDKSCVEKVSDVKPVGSYSNKFECENRWVLGSIFPTIVIVYLIYRIVKQKKGLT